MIDLREWERQKKRKATIEKNKKIKSIINEIDYLNNVILGMQLTLQNTKILRNNLHKSEDDKTLRHVEKWELDFNKNLEGNKKELEGLKKQLLEEVRK